MKRLIVLGVCFWVISLTGAEAQAGTGKVEVTFNFTRQGGYATNQFAVWVEDSGGKYIKTLYATMFTANGGWKTRDQSLPVWVKQSGLSGMKKNETDAVTGSTPQTGKVSYIWDGTNQAGLAVPAGEYRIFVEATLRNENQVMYNAAVRLGGGASEFQPNPVYKGNSARERGMIGGVKISVK
ncbi:MAG: DUF2271 domain-containing protein [Treponema sp.]|jgi:hypothetical protein|nr:DUF2271 domain-containing protein [Treponema sp.]